MRTGSVARDFDSGGQNLSWLKLYLFDVVTLTFATMAVVRFWCVYFGLHDKGLLTALAAAAGVEVTRRTAAARRAFQRPITFCGDRRRDLLAAILLAAGPWPILPTLPLPAIAAWPASTGPLLMLLGGVGVVSGVAMRTVVARDFRLSRLEPRPVRELTTVPPMHVASLFVLPNGANGLRRAYN